MGNETSYTYDKVGNTLSITDALGNKTYKEYNSLNLPVKTVFNDGSVNTYTYDSAGRLTVTTDAKGNTQKRAYDANGNLIKLTDKNGESVDYEYDAMGNLTGVTDPMGYKTTYAYDVNGNLISTTDALGNVSSMEYNHTFPAYERDKKGDGRRLDYDNLGRIVRKMEFSGAENFFTYDSVGNVTESMDTFRSKTLYSYDSANRLLSVTDKEGNTTSYRYVPSGQIGEITGADGSVIQKTYDKNARLISEKDGLGSEIKYEYDKLGRLTKEIYPDGSFKTFSYDSMGNLLIVTDEEGSVYSYEYDSVGNMVKSTDPAGAVTLYEYDNNNNLIKLINVKDGKNLTTSFEYDKKNRLVKKTNALGNSVKYTYNALNLVEKTDEDGFKTTYSYDENSNLIKEAYTGGESVSYMYKRGNLLTGYSDKAGRTSYELDLEGRITGVSGPSGDAKFTYDKEGRIKSASSYTLDVNYVYDSMGRIARIEPMGFLGSESTGDFIYEYDKAGNIVKLTKPDKSVETREYDERSRLNKISVNDKLVASYAYNKSGDLTSAYENFYQTKTDLSYTYDAAHRLTKEVRAYEDGTNQSTEYSYDSLGNILNEKATAINPLTGKAEERVTSYAYNELNSLIRRDDVDYSYDKRGNLIRESKDGASLKSYEWNKTGKLTSVTTPAGKSEYSYDGTGRMLSYKGYTYGKDKSLNLTKDEKYIPFYPSAIDLPFTEEFRKVTHVYGPEGEVGTYADYVMYSFTKDRLLSTRLVSNPKGEAVVAKDFGAYGEPIDVFTREDLVDNNVNKARYTGHVYDDIAGLYYAKARTYNPTDKRFTSLDPVMDGLNWYEYCRSNPLKYTDPTGNLVPAEAADLREKNKPKPEYHYYKPTYDFADYNSSEFMQFTNCYAYAFGMQVNPVTGEKFPVRGNQPGLLSNDKLYLEMAKSIDEIKNDETNSKLSRYMKAVTAYNIQYLLGTEKTNRNLVELVKKDSEVVGLNFEKYEEGMTGGRRVALVIKPENILTVDTFEGDYHWYVYDEISGTWSNKNGQLKATDKALRKNGTHEEDTIKDYTKAAKMLGYTIVVGEYYITRKDGKEFK